MLSRIGDIAQSDRLMVALRSTSTRLREGQIAVSTGKAATSFDQISGDASLLLRTKDQRAAAQNFVQQNEQVADRLATMDGALANLGDIAERLRALLTHRLDAASGNLVPLDREAESFIDEVAAQLNIRLDERYLFAGSRIDQPPVAIPASIPAAADPALYYQGDEVVTTVRADRDIEISYGVTAADPAFADLIAAIGLARQAHLANDRAGLEAAFNLTDLALGEVAELRGEIGATGARIEAIAESQRSTILYLDDIVSRIEDVDIPMTMTRIANDQASLEAAYLTTGRLSQLSLADYLR
jgi:flagellar hook-associated protein 3 FlgL